MAYVFEKRLQYVGSVVDMCEMEKLCGSCLKYLTNGLNMCEMM